MATTLESKRRSTSTALAAESTERQGSRLRARSLIGAARELPSTSEESPKLSSLANFSTASLIETRHRSGSFDLPPVSDQSEEEDGQVSKPSRGKMSLDMPKSTPGFMSVVIPPTPAPGAEPDTPVKAPPLGRRFTTSLPTFQPNGVAPAALVGPSAVPATGRPPFRLVARPIGMLAGIFLASFAVVAVLVTTIPTLRLPHSLADVAAEAVKLREYSATGPMAWLHVWGVLSTLFVFKQTFSSSVLMNVLFGCIYSVVEATIYTSILTAVGSLGAYGLAMFCEPLVRGYFPSAIESLERKVDAKGQRPAQLFQSLLLWRLLPVLPYSALNVASGVLRLPIWPFFASLVCGSLPYNAVVVQAGSILASGSDMQSIWSVNTAIKLVGISGLAAAPVIFKDRIRRLLGGEEDEGTKVERQTLFSRRSPSVDELEMKHYHRRTASLFESIDEGSPDSDFDEPAGSAYPVLPPRW